MLKLICTDLDRTLIPNGEHPESPEAAERFRQLTTAEGISLAYVTGRDRAAVKQAMVEFRLPEPNFVIADVGASIYRVSHSIWKRLEKWDELLTKSWGGRQSGDISKRLIDITALQLQEAGHQKPHKLSYYLNPGCDIETIIAAIDLRLKGIDVRTNIIWSIEQSTQIGLLDILPETANKRKAIEFLLEVEGFSIESTVFSGDSGNDLDVMISPIKSILVANADPETRNTVRREAGDNLKSVYIASGQGSMNGNYSAGILEGIYHYFPELKNR